MTKNQIIHPPLTLRECEACQFLFMDYKPGEIATAMGTSLNEVLSCIRTVSEKYRVKPTELLPLLEARNKSNRLFIGG